MADQNVKSTCPYCGVGCGVIANASKIVGDPSHPANQGALCVKGSSLITSLKQPQRLLYPKIAGKTVEWEQATIEIAETIKRVCDESGPSAIGMYLSGQLLTEDYYVANKLMKGFIGSSHVDTNSRLCMSSAVAAHIRAFGEDVVAANYSDLENTDLIVLIGSNLAWTHPIVYKRVQQAKKQNPDLKIVVIDPRQTVTAEQADLYLALANDSDVYLYKGLMRYLIDNDALDNQFIVRATQGFDELHHELTSEDYSTENVSLVTSIDQKLLEQFYQWFKDAPRAVTVFCQGVNQSVNGTDKANSIINSHLLTGKIAKLGCGPFSITGQPNAMGGREVGGLANQLAVHRGFDEQSITEVKQFWQAPNIGMNAGHKAVELFDAVEKGEIRVLWIMATNPAISMPDTDQIRRALEKCECVIVSDITPDTDTARYADILLPAAAWGEKSGMVTNSERVISRQRSFLPMPGETKADWKMICEVAQKLGFKEAFDFLSVADVFREHAALSGINSSNNKLFDISHLAMLSDDEYDTWQPKQWPMNATNQQIFEQQNGYPVFPSASGKAQLVIPKTNHSRATSCLKAVDLKLENTFWLNTGRNRDQWHTMTRTGHVAALMQSEVEPCIYIHPESAKQAGLVEGKLVVIKSLQVNQRQVDEKRARHLAKVSFDSGLSKQQAFMSMHWAGSYGSASAANQSVLVKNDPISGQPAFKSSQVTIEPIDMGFYGASIGHVPESIAPNYISYQTLQPVGVWRYAGQMKMDKHSLLGELSQTGEQYLLIEQVWGFALVQLKPATKINSELVCDALHFFSEQPLGLDLSSLAELISKPLNIESFLNKMGCNNFKQQLVCTCFQVTDVMIKHALDTHQITSLSALTQQLKCGTNCGTCLPQVERLWADHQQLIPTITL
ncbi:nitrate reductase [Photobacterium leiognathi]|uniref:nitrate reductase n=1 Tax=Photobacterium leiognathi TaxID=553611 RepID=UPI00273A40DE|nr:nitrate reductase [Photobacterium leiognathi]